MADDVEMTPIAPEENGGIPPKVSPFGAAPDPGAAPAAPAAAPAAGVSTIKLKPVIRKPVIHKPVIRKPGTAPAGVAPAPAAAAPAEAPAAEKAAPSLKSVTGPIPAQATLKKTGIIAEGIITPQQQQAAKSKTSRISLESAIGVAPVKSGPAPLKTIRLRRPTDLKPPAPAAPAPVPEAAPVTAPAPAAEPVAPVAAASVAAVAPEQEAADAASVTQRRTLKLGRPGGVGVKRPTLGIRKDEPAAAAEGDVAEMPPVGEVPELKPLSPLEFAEAETGGAASAGGSSFMTVLSLVASLAALVVVGAVLFYLWKEGVATDGAPAGPNEMQFIQM